ncbi:unnamed protein product [Sphagnum troendelagicum]|uniref:Uncharacterized protein n=1 Tax=Sphagnum troendelagicum TaxID=128251 RepID=A0ABP0UMK2_9BRYO
MSLQALIVAQALVPSSPSICCSVVNSKHSSPSRRPWQQLPQASLRNASLRAANVEQVSTLFSGGGDKNNNGRVGGGGDGGGGGGSSGGSGGSHGGFEDQSGVPLVHVTAWSLLWARYMENLDRYPLVVKSLTAGCLNALADLICQVFVEKVDTVEIKRLLSFVAIGIFMSGPGLHYWYGTLSKFITVPGMGGVVLRIAADQLVFTPFGICGFFVALLSLEGRQSEISDKLHKDLLETVVANWKVWIPFQVVNFGFVPPHLQVAAAGVLGMVWSIFISFKGHS